MVFLHVIASILIVCLISLAGIATFWFKPKLLDEIIFFLVALSAGALLGDAFLHLLPEALEEMHAQDFGVIFIASFSFFFLLEKIIHWRHCHGKPNCVAHSFAYINLFGEAIHNFIDGVIIAAAYLASIPLGIATTIAVIAHEIPQEVSDFGVLVYAGFSKKKALSYNFGASLTALLGAITGYYLAGSVIDVKTFLLPVAAGSFSYIASSDLVPELRKQQDLKKSLKAFAVFLLGVAIMKALTLLE